MVKRPSKTPGHPRSITRTKKKAVIKRIAKPSPDTALPIPDNANFPLSPKPYPEIVIGLVAPVVIDLGPIAKALERELKAVQYKVRSIDLSNEIENFLKTDHSDERTEERIQNLMSDGTMLREESGRGDAVVLLGIAEIHRVRKAELKNNKEKNAFILRSLKHPQEVQTLRNVYGKGFFLVSVYTPREARVSAMADKITRSHHGNASHVRSDAELIVERDEMEEHTRLGQDVKDAFPLADLFIDGRDRKSFEAEIKRFIQLIFRHLFHTPTRDEHGMYHARSAALRSADLGRQVGAAISAPSGDLLSLGCNDVPKAGGGLYWPGDSGDARDFQKGFDPIVEERKQILSELLLGLKNAGVLSPSYANDEDIAPLTLKLISDKKMKKHLKTARVMNLLEFGRSVHAEMAALTTAARLGISVKGATLFTTTFPCHMCARHIVSSGISRVVYVEPYPKSKARQLHSDSICVDPESAVPGLVTFEPFVGIAPRQYQDLFDAQDKRKDDEGNIFDWRPEHTPPRPRFLRFRLSYYEIEEMILAEVIPWLTKIFWVD